MGWRIPLSVSVLAGCLLSGCGDGATRDQGDPQGAEGGSVPDYESIADLLLARMDLQPGEEVLLVAQAGRWDPLLPLLQSGVAEAGATDLGAVDVFGMPVAAAHPRPFADELAATDASGWREALDGVELAVMLPGAVPTEADVDVYRALQDVLRAGRGRTIHFHWEGATAMDGATLAVDGEVDRTYQAALLETDYEALGEAQRAFESALRGGQVRVTTPAGTDLSFRVEDRPVTRQDGDASAARAATARNLIDREVELPAGAVRVAPVLSSVRGTIVFPPAVWGGERVEGLRVRFEEGRVVEASADLGIEGFERETSAAGEAGRSFRELALGFNPLLAVPESSDPWIPYYGYGAGVVRLSLGDNTELGGAVGGGYVRWNFFTDATVEIDGFAWVRDGRMPPSR